MKKCKWDQPFSCRDESARDRGGSPGTGFSLERRSSPRRWRASWPTRGFTDWSRPHAVSSHRRPFQPILVSSLALALYSPLYWGVPRADSGGAMMYDGDDFLSSSCRDWTICFSGHSCTDRSRPRAGLLRCPAVSLLSMDHRMRTRGVRSRFSLCRRRLLGLAASGFWPSWSGP